MGRARRCLGTPAEAVVAENRDRRAVVRAGREQPAAGGDERHGGAQEHRTKRGGIGERAAIALVPGDLRPKIRRPFAPDPSGLGVALALPADGAQLLGLLVELRLVVAAGLGHRLLEPLDAGAELALELVALLLLGVVLGERGAQLGAEPLRLGERLALADDVLGGALVVLGFRLLQPCALAGPAEAGRRRPFR